MAGEKDAPEEQAPWMGQPRKSASRGLTCVRKAKAKAKAKQDAKSNRVSGPLSGAVQDTGAVDMEAKETSHELKRRQAAERKSLQAKVVDLKRQRKKLPKKKNKDDKKAPKVKLTVPHGRP